MVMFVSFPAQNLSDVILAKSVANKTPGQKLLVE